MAFGKIDIPPPNTNFGEIRGDSEWAHIGCWQEDSFTGSMFIEYPPTPAPPVPGPSGRIPVPVAGPAALPYIIFEGLFTRRCSCRFTNEGQFPPELHHTDVGACAGPKSKRSVYFTKKTYNGECITNPIFESEEGKDCKGFFQADVSGSITPNDFKNVAPFGYAVDNKIGPSVNPPQWAIDCGLKDVGDAPWTPQPHSIPPRYEWGSTSAAACALEYINCKPGGLHREPPIANWPYPETPGDVLAGILDDYLSDFYVPLRCMAGDRIGL